MNEPTLKQAMIILQRRKRALADGAEEVIAITVQLDEGGVRKMLLGSGVTAEEMGEGALKVLKIVTAALLIEDDYEIPQAICSSWSDGVLTGLILADLRQKHNLANRTVHEVGRAEREENG
jgi:hypothetical protein